MLGGGTREAAVHTKLSVSWKGLKRRSRGRCGRKSYGAATFLLTQADWHRRQQWQRQLYELVMLCMWGTRGGDCWPPVRVQRRGLSAPQKENAKQHKNLNRGWLVSAETTQNCLHNRLHTSLYVTKVYVMAKRLRLLYSATTALLHMRFNVWFLPLNTKTY